jgi:Lar family restriction alleviation protein
MIEYLKPCPFCGTEEISPSLIYIDNGYGVRFMNASCGGCEAEGPPVRETFDEAADRKKACRLWNTREVQKD